MIDLPEPDNASWPLATEPISSAVEWSAAAVRLLQGVVYHDDNAKTWDTLLRSVSP